MFQRSWVRILALYTGWTFFTFILQFKFVKIVMFVWKDENKWKRGRGWHAHFGTQKLNIKLLDITRWSEDIPIRCVLQTTFLQFSNMLKNLQTYSGAYATIDWYNEVSKYSYGSGFSSATGHFTQGKVQYISLNGGHGPMMIFLLVAAQWWRTFSCK